MFYITSVSISTILSANGHPTEKISEFIDFHLRPFVENLPSHIKDTTDYLRKMENLAIPENTTLVTVDVTSLYTNIPHDDGITACRKIWEQRTDQEPPTECLVERLTLVMSIIYRLCDILGSIYDTIYESSMKIISWP